MIAGERCQYKSGVVQLVPAKSGRCRRALVLVVAAVVVGTAIVTAGLCLSSSSGDDAGKVAVDASVAIATAPVSPWWLPKSASVLGNVAATAVMASALQYWSTRTPTPSPAMASAPVAAQHHQVKDVATRSGPVVKTLRKALIGAAAASAVGAAAYVALRRTGIPEHEASLRDDGPRSMDHVEPSADSEQPGIVPSTSETVSEPDTAIATSADTVVDKSGSKDPVKDLLHAPSTSETISEPDTAIATSADTVVDKPGSKDPVKDLLHAPSTSETISEPDTDRQVDSSVGIEPPNNSGVCTEGAAPTNDIDSTAPPSSSIDGAKNGSSNGVVGNDGENGGTSINDIDSTAPPSSSIDGAENGSSNGVVGNDGENGAASINGIGSASSLSPSIDCTEKTSELDSNLRGAVGPRSATGDKSTLSKKCNDKSQTPRQGENWTRVRVKSSDKSQMPHKGGVLSQHLFPNLR